MKNNHPFRFNISAKSVSYRFFNKCFKSLTEILPSDVFYRVGPQLKKEEHLASGVAQIFSRDYSIFKTKKDPGASSLFLGMGMELTRMHKLRHISTFLDFIQQKQFLKLVPFCQHHHIHKKMKRNFAFLSNLFFWGGHLPNDNTLWFKCCKIIKTVTVGPVNKFLIHQST